jgi:hypothetical protein
MAIRYIGDANSQNKIRGAADGAAIPAGYVGQVLSSVQSSAANIPGATGAFGDMASFSLTAGVWMIYAACSLARNSATFTSTDIALGVSTTSGNSGTGLNLGINFTNPGAVIPTTFARCELALAPLVVRCDGTTITRVDDNTAFATGTTLYLKLYVSSFSAATPQYTGKLVAVRIA